MNIRKLQFHHISENGAIVFESIDMPRKYYNRQFEGPATFCWYSSTPNYFENDCRIKDNVILEIVDDKGTVLFTEQNNNEPSPWWKEQEKLLKDMVDKYTDQYCLLDYETYKKIMKGYMADVDYTGYQDNFLWGEKDFAFPEYIENEKLEFFHYMFWDCYIERTSYKHKYLNKVINIYSVMRDEYTTVEIIGFGFKNIIQRPNLTEKF